MEILADEGESHIVPVRLRVGRNVADISNQNSNMDIAISMSNIFLKPFNSSDYFGVGSSDIKFEQVE